MYGLVNRAIEELVVERAGRLAWEVAKRRAGVQVPSFISMRAYPDQMSFDLVAAASHVLGIPVPEVLREFGRHWVLFTGGGAYGSLFRVAGSSVREVLQGLDGLHSRLSTSMPELLPPSVAVVGESAEGLRVRYESSREGLEAMMIGLIEGLGELFETPVEVEHVVSRAQGAEAEEFLVRFAKPD